MELRQRQFEALVEAHAPDLYRYAYWLCHNRALAEDLVQETLLRAWKGLDGLRDADAVRGWLITILRRECARHYARKQPQTISLDAEAMEMLEDPALPGNTPEVLALREGLASLTGKYREPLLLQVLGGFSCEEIAAQLDISAAAVMTRLFRARQALRRKLAGDEPGKTTVAGRDLTT